MPTPDAPGDGSGLEIQAPSFGGSAATTSDVGLGGGQDTRPERPASIGQVAVASNPSAAQPTVDTASAAVPDVSTEVVLEDTGAPAEGRVNLTPATLVPGAALTDNAVAFDVAPGKPLMSIILLDTGAAEALRQGLLTLSAPITFGVTASLENAPLIAAAYRTAGNEVVAVLPDAGQVFQRGDDPAAFRALISGALAAVPVATALVDRVDGPLPLDPNLAQGAIDTLTVTGHALLTHRGVGLNRVPEQAAEADVTGGIIYRVVGGQPGDITAALDQAVAEAAQTGSVIVMGRMEPQTVTALFSWLLGPVANRVSIAPVSTVLAN
ncbi:MAG: divergent polysaccharide deacetylase family protein [Pseudomonadota bacterium]